MVVSEIIDKLSPNIAPPTTVPIANAAGISVACANPNPTGANAQLYLQRYPLKLTQTYKLQIIQR